MPPPRAGGHHPSPAVPCPARSLHRDLCRRAAAAVLGSRQPASPAGHPAAEPHGELGDRDGAGLRHSPHGDVGSRALSPRRTCCLWTRRRPLSPTSLPVRCAWLLAVRWQVGMSPGAHRRAVVSRVTRRLLGAAHHPVGPARGHLLSPTSPTPPGEQHRGTALRRTGAMPGADDTLPREGGAPVPLSTRPQVVAELPPLGQELSLRWVTVEDAPTVPGITWKTLMVQPPCGGQSPAPHGERPGAPRHPAATGCWGPLGGGGREGSGGTRYPGQWGLSRAPSSVQASSPSRRCC